MTEKEKAIEDETIEVSAESTEKKTKKPHRRRAIVITVVVLALLTAGGIAWKAHADRLMAEARADCAAASERLRTATNDWNTLLNGSAADAAKTDRKSVKDAKMLDALSKTMKATIPKTVSCKADSRTGVQEAAKAITANAAWYKTHAKALSKAVKASNRPNSTRPWTTRRRSTTRPPGRCRTTRPAQACWTPSKSVTRMPSARP